MEHWAEEVKKIGQALKAHEEDTVVPVGTDLKARLVYVILCSKRFCLARSWLMGHEAPQAMPVIMDASRNSTRFPFECGTREAQGKKLRRRKWSQNFGF